MDKRDPKNLLPEEEYLKQMGALPKAKAPEDFLQKVHERIERRSAFEKIMRALFVPVKIKVPLELAAMAAVIVLIISTVGIKKPVEQLAYAPKAKMAAGDVVIMKSELSAKNIAGEDRSEMSREEEVKNLVGLAEGKVTAVVNDKDTGMPQYVDAEIPAGNYAKFVEKLASIGVIQEPILKEAPQGRDIVQVRIKLLAK